MLSDVTVNVWKYERQEHRTDLTSITGYNLEDKTRGITLSIARDINMPTRTQASSIIFPSHPNLQHLLQKVDISNGALGAVLQGPVPQLLDHFLVVCGSLVGWENNVVWCIIKKRYKLIVPCGRFNTGPDIKVKMCYVRPGKPFIGFYLCRCMSCQSQIKFKKEK